MTVRNQVSPYASQKLSLTETAYAFKLMKSILNIILTPQDRLIRIFPQRGRNALRLRDDAAAVRTAQDVTDVLPFSDIFVCGIQDPYAVFLLRQTPENLFYETLRIRLIIPEGQAVRGTHIISHTDAVPIKFDDAERFVRVGVVHGVPPVVVPENSASALLFFFLKMKQVLSYFFLKIVQVLFNGTIITLPFSCIKYYYLAFPSARKTPRSPSKTALLGFVPLRAKPHPPHEKKSLPEALSSNSFVCSQKYILS
jgi:hypothetical protein